MRLLIRVLIILLIVGSAAAQSDAPFDVVVVRFPDELPLGVLLEVSVEARNASGHPVTVAFGEPPLFLEIVDDEGNRVAQCPELDVVAKRGAKIREVPATWIWRENLLRCAQDPGTFNARVVMKSSWVELQPTTDGPQPWSGTANSPTFSFRVFEPTGLDREVYEAFGGDPLPIVDREGVVGQLLRRFPTSTYAAYAIWKRWGKFSFPEWNTSEDREATLSWLAKNPDEEYLTWRMPCTEDGEPDASVETRFEARLALTCRDHWLSAVLRNHPEIWFGDEIRYRLAIDRYRLGQRESGIADLQNLAENGKPYIASTAAELLSAMKAKGMLEEKEK